MHVPSYGKRLQYGNYSIVPCFQTIMCQNVDSIVIGGGEGAQERCGNYIGIVGAEISSIIF